MSERTLIPIFVFWALLTIITPSLVLLSENSKAELHVKAKMTEAMKARRMMGYLVENHNIRTTAAGVAMVAAKELMPAPEAAPPIGRATAMKKISYHNHNHTIGSNATNHELMLLFPKEHKETKIRSTSI